MKDVATMSLGIPWDCTDGSHIDLFTLLASEAELASSQWKHDDDDDDDDDDDGSYDDDRCHS